MRKSIKDDSYTSHLCNTMNSGTIVQTQGTLEEAWAVLLLEGEGENPKFLSTGCLRDKKQKNPAVTRCLEVSKGCGQDTKFWNSLAYRLAQGEKKKDRRRRKDRIKP